MSERLFFALWPDESTRARLADAARILYGECGGKKTKAESIHLTLVFLGEVETGKVGLLRGIASRIAESAFEVRMDRAGYWKHNRIVWAGMTTIPPELGRLVTVLQQGLRVGGFEFDGRAWFPHVTLVRKADAPRIDPDFQAFSWPVSEFCLAASTASGYAILDKWLLPAPQR